MAYRDVMGIAARERTQLADALDKAGPDAATLCEGWTTRDLAAHVVLRDRRPDAALGMFLPQLSSRLENVTEGYLHEEFGDLVGKVRSGAAISPARFGPIDDAMNTLEFAVHTEDVRRAMNDWEPRPRNPQLDAAITGRLKVARGLLTRKSPVSLGLRTPDGFSAGPADAAVTVVGDPLELLMFCFGRQAAARVGYDGPDSDVQAVKQASFGF